MKRKVKTSSAILSPEKKAYLINAIKDHGAMLQEKKITAGFDGFIDTIAKVIKKKQAKRPPSLFTTIKEFGNYIVEKEGTSLSLEIEERSSKLGGNMPILANALGQLAATVNCVGALGYPQIHPAFKNFHANCHLYSFADPGTATAFEFNDGKIMMAQMTELNSFGWDKIKNKIGIDTLISLYKQSDLICLLNLSEIDASTDIWKGFLKDVFPKYSFTGEKQITFFDLSDCSKRSSESIKEMLELLQEFAKHTRVILSLNKNEAHIIYKTLFDKSSKKDLSGIGKKIFEKIGIHTLVLHSAREVIAFTNEESVAVNTFFISDPKISTGAGDNFNAGFCAAQLLQLDLESSVILANAVSGYYVRTGTSAQLPDIINFLETMPTTN
jgi:hypothetical protein